MPRQRRTSRKSNTRPLHIADTVVRDYESNDARYDTWMQYRGLTPETVDRFRLGVGKLPGDKYSQYPTRMILPVFDNEGVCRVLRARSIVDDGPKWLTYGSSILYAPKGIPFNAIMMIVENNATACLVAQCAPHLTLLSPTCGAQSWNKNWPIWIAAKKPKLVIVAGDNDTAGIKMTARWIRELSVVNILCESMVMTEETETKMIKGEWSK